MNNENKPTALTFAIVGIIVLLALIQTYFYESVMVFLIVSFIVLLYKYYKGEK